MVMSLKHTLETKVIPLDFYAFPTDIRPVVHYICMVVFRPISINDILVVANPFAVENPPLSQGLLPSKMFSRKQEKRSLASISVLLDRIHMSVV